MNFSLVSNKVEEDDDEGEDLDFATRVREGKLPSHRDHPVLYIDFVITLVIFVIVVIIFTLFIFITVIIVIIIIIFTLFIFVLLLLIIIIIVQPETTLTAVSSSIDSRCSLPLSQGTCRDYTILWYYDKQANSCAQFWYGGCGGNDNRYDTEEECKETCVVSWTGKCPQYYQY
ncbi:Collagen alpha-1(XXVIII) chain [Merluccius polli]|uniref:Collagen alpha-1(XXVIII) chain n=1 Tax=Merluccius polli TaxID=89951 RepID=A0AA47MRZ0_MERPO|nr:Collagen alpha-1(XXVIII) chain [Merluccius polli]